ncbi:hypothetical protein Tco_0655051 [Tanacetum coccineum]|uniref:Uncharacterized protein n=1 Tax=Tanacetum coccineum TaxID=301880 RepID=A0ABQ4X597_9ASTR
MNQQHEQQALLVAQREQELLAQKQAAHEKEEPPQNSVFRQLIEEMCGTKASAEQKQKLEDTMLELLEDCRQKSFIICIIMKSMKLRISPVNAIIHNLPTKEPEYSLSMGDEHLDTIPETESDELIKSSVENLVPIPSESKDISDGKCELPLCDDSSKTQFTTFSNPLFDSNDDFSSSDVKSFSEEDVPMEEFKIYSNPLFDLDEEIISSEENSISNEVLDEINLIPLGMNDCFNAESDLIESLLNRDTSIDSFHKIDSLLDEFAGKLSLLKPINLIVCSTDKRLDSIDHCFNDDLVPLFKYNHFTFDVEPDTTVKNDFDELNEDECFDPRGGEIDVFANVEDDDYFPFTFVIRIFLPYLTYPEVSPLLISTGSEDLTIVGIRPVPANTCP